MTEIWGRTFVSEARRSALLMACLAMLLAAAIPLTSAAASEPLVPCGKSEKDLCTIDHLIQLGLNIFDWLLAIGGAAALLAIIVAGLKYITGVLQGADQAVGEAKKSLQYAILGLLILLLAFVIVRTIVEVIFRTMPEFTSPAL